MTGYNVQVEAEVRTPVVHVQINSIQWPERGELIVLDRDEYVLTQRLCPDPAIWLDADDLHTLGPSGTLQLKPPRFPIRVRLSPGWQRTCVCAFDPAFVERTTDIAGDWDDDVIGLCCSIRKRFLSSIMMRVRQELEHPCHATAAIIEAAGKLLLAELSSYLAQGRRAASARVRNGGLAPWQLRVIKERIKAVNLGAPRLDALAALCGLSQFHMMRQFKASTGLTVHRYIEEIRLAAAKQMLADDNMSIKEVAARLGFSSQRYFSAAFRRLMTVAPTEYRVQARSYSACAAIAARPK
jgi:AraC family transcriptional regulator